MKIGAVAFLFFLLAATTAYSESISRSQWVKVQDLKGISSSPGLNNPSLYVFFDPNCVASARLFSMVVNETPFEKLDAVWIPVGVMDRSSLGKSASILRSSDFSLIKKNFLSFNFKNGLGAIKEVEASNDEIYDIRRSNDVLNSLSSTPGTPMIVYRDKKGNYSLHLGYKPEQEIERIVAELGSSRISAY